MGRVLGQRLVCGARFPRKTAPTSLQEEPVPDWLLYLGIGLAAFGLLLGLLVALVGPRRSVPGEPVRDLSAAWVFVPLIAILWAAAICVGLVADDSAYRWRPVGGAVIVSTVPPLMWRLGWIPRPDG